MCQGCVKVQHPERVGHLILTIDLHAWKLCWGPFQNIVRASKMSPRCITLFLKMEWSKSWKQVTFDTPGMSDHIVQSFCFLKFQLFSIFS